VPAWRPALHERAAAGPPAHAGPRPLRAQRRAAAAGQARPQGRATGAPAQAPQKYGAPKLNYVLTISAVSQKKKLLVLVLYNLSI